MDELIESAKQTLSERLSSPLLSSFLISWCAWNWKFLVILFSDAGVSVTFALVDKYCFPTFWDCMSHGLLFPLATSLAYVFVYPFAAYVVYGFTLHRQKANNQLKQKIAEETLMTLEESNFLRATYVEYERKKRQEIDELREEVARLTAALNAKDAKEFVPVTKAEQMYDKLSESQVSLMKYIATKNGSVPEEHLARMTNKTKVQTDFDLGELLRRELVKRKFNYTDRRNEVVFTQEGRRAVLELSESSTKEEN